MATIFTSYKIKRLWIKFVAASGAAVLGVLDDIVGEGDGPSTIADVSELRSSAINFGYQSGPSTIYWEPVDKNLWYKTFETGTNTNELYECGNLYGASFTGSTIQCQMEVSYELVFKGACDVGGTFLQRIQKRISDKSIGTSSSSMTRVPLIQNRF